MYIIIKRRQDWPGIRKDTVMVSKRSLLAATLLAVMPAQVNAAGCDQPQWTNRQRIQCLEQQLDKLVQNPPAPITSLNNVVIEWKGHDGVCLAILDGNNFPQLRETCSDAARQRFNIRQ